MASSAAAPAASTAQKALSAISFRIPALKGLEQKVTTGGVTDFTSLRKSAWETQGLYWWNKVANFPAVWQQAKVDAVSTAKLLKSPADLTVGQLTDAAVCGVQVAGVFCLGEAFGRGSFTHYKVPGEVLKGGH